MKIDYIYSYSYASKSANELSRVSGIPLLNVMHVGKLPDNTVVFNWGCGDLPRFVRYATIINEENAVRRAVNKIAAFRSFEANGFGKIPVWTTDPADAERWLNTDKRAVYARTTVEGHDGDGIILVKPGDKLPKAKLYTKKIENIKNEYRITLFNGELVTRQKKVKRHDVERHNPDIKTTAGGYGFDVVATVPVGIIPAAREATTALGLDFGGVDVVHCTDGAIVVLEVNTAPCLTPLACQNLSKLLKEYRVG